MAERHRPDKVAGSTRKSGSQYEPFGAGHRASQHTPGHGKDIQPADTVGDRGPTGSHLENTQPNRQVDPVATRKGQEPDLSFPR